MATGDFSEELSSQHIISRMDLHAALCPAALRCGRCHTPTRYQKNCSQDRSPAAATPAIRRPGNQSIPPCPTCHIQFRPLAIRCVQTAEISCACRLTGLYDVECAFRL